MKLFVFIMCAIAVALFAKDVDIDITSIRPFDLFVFSVLLIHSFMDFIEDFTDWAERWLSKE